MDDGEAEEIEFDCFNCGKKSSKTIEWIGKNEAYFCECGALIKARKLMMENSIRALRLQIEKLKNNPDR